VIGERAGQRVVSVRDDGAGFESDADGAGQGLKNIRARSAAIEGALALRSRPGCGTELVVTLRA
jgi:signal transduction histidine kinase